VLFFGKMPLSNWAMIAKCPRDIADRDIAAGLDNGLQRKGEVGGRRTHYELAL
jgi:hypothetical protein